MSQLALPLGHGVTDVARIPRSQRVHVNRNLRMEGISWVGFDMDYTLAIYRHPAMDQLAVEATVAKLVAKGYPESFLAMPFRYDFPVRGLHVDKKLGNVLKMDRYRYVKRAYHGSRELTKDERRQHYHTSPLRAGTKRFHWVDTLYTLPEVTIYAAAIDHLEARGGEVDYATLWDDVRAAIDVSHQDGSILDRIASDPERFVARDAELGPTLHKLRSAGKKLFVLTNSRPEYTRTMLSYLLDRGSDSYATFRSYFDAIVCTARKPVFFTETDQAFRPCEPGLPAPSEHGFVPGRLYEGGCLAELDRILGVADDEVLYVGDHIYGDVLRAKKETAWRTLMIVQDMETEAEVLDRLAPEIARVDELAELQESLADEVRALRQMLHELEAAIAAAPDGADTQLAAARVDRRRALGRARRKLEEVEAEEEALERSIEDAMHPYWGPVFTAGHEISSFGEQVEKYACLYTTRVSNLGRYSPLHYFRGPRDRLPHQV